MPPNPPDLSHQLSHHLYTTKSLLPTPAWLAAFLASQQRAATTPLPALVQTAGWRLLNSDITETLAAVEGGCFPVDVGEVGLGERRVGGGERGVVCQVLAIEDMSKSRWEQIEAIEALERGEGTRGREIIRVAPPVADGDGTTTAAATGSGGSAGPHKLLLQDAAGRKCWAIELRNVDGVAVGMSIGCKMLLKGALVARGHLLLEPGTTSVLGGKIEEMERRWREGRKGELKAQLETEAEVRIE